MITGRFKQLIQRMRGQAAPEPMPTGMAEFERYGLKLRLDMDHWLGREVYQTGVFEPMTIQWIDRLLRPGMNVVDVGANIGYFSVILAKRVAPRGHVWAFEPTTHYGDQARWHIEHNGVDQQVTLDPVGLSDAAEQVQITIGESSATIHPMSESHHRLAETITLETLDSAMQRLDLPPIDFIKVDVDGHEPRFLAGARQFFEKHRPTMLIEFYQGNLDVAGSDVRELREQVEALGYELRSEKTGEPFPDRHAFLQECGNFTHSVNVLALPREAASALAA